MYIKDSQRKYTLGSPLPSVVKWEPHRKPENSPTCDDLLYRSDDVSRIDRQQATVKKKISTHDQNEKSEDFWNSIFKQQENDSSIQTTSLFHEPQQLIVQSDAGGSHSERMAKLETAFVGKGIPSDSQRAWKPSSRAFAISVLQLLGDTEPIKKIFLKSERQTLRGFEFVDNMMKLIQTRRSLQQQNTTQNDTWKLSERIIKSYNTRSAIRSRETTLMHEWAALSSSRPSSQHSMDYLGTNRFAEWSLASLFSEIDMNSKDEITWEDLNAYLIGASIKNDSFYHDQLTPLIRSYILTTYKTGRVDTTPGSKRTCGSGAAIKGLRKIRYIDGLSRMIFLGKDNICRLVNPTGMRVIQSYPWDINYGKTLDLDILLPGTQGNHVLATSTSDGCVRLYDIGTTHQYSVTNLKVSQTSLFTFERDRSKLLCGSRQGRVIWLKIGSDYCSKEISNTVVHSGAISCFLLLPDNMLATASLDSSICISNPHSMKPITKLIGHSQGVHCMDYAQHYNFIASSGQEPYPYLWVPSCGMAPKPLILRDPDPHLGKISKLCCVPNTPQLLSIDCRGCLKVWDLRMLKSVHTVNCSPNARTRTADSNERSAFATKMKRQQDVEASSVDGRESFSDLFYFEKNKMILTCGGADGAAGSLQLLNYEKIEKKVSLGEAEQYAVAATCLLITRKQIITAASNHVRLWDGETGIPLRILFTCNEVVTSLAVNSPIEDRVFAGLDDGTLYIFNTCGIQVASFAHHLGGIQRLVYTTIRNTEILISSEGNGRSQVLIDPSGSKQTMVAMQLCDFLKTSEKTDAYSLQYSQRLEYLLLGETRNVISIWRLQSPKGPLQSAPEWRWICNCVNNPKHATVTALQLIETLHQFVSADACGGLHLWDISGVQLCSWVSYCSSNVSNLPVVTGMVYYSGESKNDLFRSVSILYCIDDCGYTTVYDLQGIPQNGNSDPSYLSFFSLPPFQPNKVNKKVVVRDEVVASNRRKHVKLITFWKSHEGRCTTIASTQHLKSSCLVTTGEDCAVRFWSMWGRLLGKLSKSNAQTHEPLPIAERSTECINNKLKISLEKRTQQRYRSTVGPLSGALHGLINWTEADRGVDEKGNLINNMKINLDNYNQENLNKSFSASTSYIRESVVMSESEFISRSVKKRDYSSVPYVDIPPPWTLSSCYKIYGYSENIDTLNIIRDTAPAVAVTAVAGIAKAVVRGRKKTKHKPKKSAINIMGKSINPDSPRRQLLSVSSSKHALLETRHTMLNRLSSVTFLSQPDRLTDQEYERSINNKAISIQRTIPIQEAVSLSIPEEIENMKLTMNESEDFSMMINCIKETVKPKVNLMGIVAVRKLLEDGTRVAMKSFIKKKQRTIQQELESYNIVIITPAEDAAVSTSLIVVACSVHEPEFLTSKQKRDLALKSITTQSSELDSGTPDYDVSMRQLTDLSSIASNRYLDKKKNQFYTVDHDTNKIIAVSPVVLSPTLSEITLRQRNKSRNINWKYKVLSPQFKTNTTIRNVFNKKEHSYDDKSDTSVEEEQDDILKRMRLSIPDDSDGQRSDTTEEGDDERNTFKQPIDEHLPSTTLISTPYCTITVSEPTDNHNENHMRVAKLKKNRNYARLCTLGSRTSASVRSLCSSMPLVYKFTSIVAVVASLVPLVKAFVWIPRQTRLLIEVTPLCGLLKRPIQDSERPWLMSQPLGRRATDDLLPVDLKKNKQSL